MGWLDMLRRPRKQQGKRVLPTTRALLGWQDRPAHAPIGGLLAYYGLTEWWLATFTHDEREDIEWICAPLGSNAHLLTDGIVTSSPRSSVEFLCAVERSCKALTNPSIGRRVRERIRAFDVAQEPGILAGKHYTAYLDEVRRLRRAGDDAKAEALLLRLLDPIEADARVGVAFQSGSMNPPPWYYEQLAIIARKRKDVVAERAILERFARVQHAPTAKPSKLLERLDKLRAGP